MCVCVGVEAVVCGVCGLWGVYTGGWLAHVRAEVLLGGGLLIKGGVSLSHELHHTTLETQHCHSCFKELVGRGRELIAQTVIIFLEFCNKSEASEQRLTVSARGQQAIL